MLFGALPNASPRDCKSQPKSQASEKPDDKDAPDGKGSPATGAPGSRASSLVKVDPQGRWTRLGTTKLSHKRCREYFGKDVCVAYACTRLKDPRLVCPYWGQTDSIQLPTLMVRRVEVLAPASSP